MEAKFGELARAKWYGCGEVLGALPVGNGEGCIMCGDGTCQFNDPLVVCECGFGWRCVRVLLVVLSGEGVDIVVVVCEGVLVCGVAWVSLDLEKDVVVRCVWDRLELCENFED